MHAALLANVFSDVADFVGELTDWLADFSANWWFLLIIFVVAFLDSVIPIVPSETMVIIGGVAAGQGEQSLWLVIAAGATGAFLGDNTAYLIGARMSGFIQRQTAKRPKWQARFDWGNDRPLIVCYERAGQRITRVLWVMRRDLRREGGHAAV